MAFIRGLQHFIFCYEICIYSFDSELPNSWWNFHTNFLHGCCFRINLCCVFVHDFECFWSNSFDAIQRYLFYFGSRCFLRKCNKNCLRRYDCSRAQWSFEPCLPINGLCFIILRYQWMDQTPIFLWIISRTHRTS